MKKLLILGGSRYALPVIEEAHKLDIEVVTADYLQNNYAHKYADSYENISVINKADVLRVAEKLQINGITSFGTDPGVVSAAYVAEQMGLPTPGPYDSVCILQNKGKFRDFLKKNGFNCPDARSYVSVVSAMDDVFKWKYPVIVKPTDSAGSKGVTRVNNEKELEVALNIALENSIGTEGEKSIIVEEYLFPDGGVYSCDCLAVDGELITFHIDEQYFDILSPNKYMPAAHVWPGEIEKQHATYFKREINRLFKLLNMKTSIYNIEMRVSDGIPYIMEVSPRGGGNHLAKYIDLITGSNLVESAVRMAVGMNIEVRNKPIHGFWLETILHSLEDGVFNEIEIEESIKPKIKVFELWAEKGEQIQGFKGANTSLGQIVMGFNNRNELWEVLNSLEKRIIVKLGGGYSMIHSNLVRGI